MAGSGDERAAGAGDRNLVRASDAAREQVIAVLKAAFVAGRLTKDELDLRVGQVLVSRTYADLAAVTADIPAGVGAGQPVRPTVPARPTRRTSSYPRQWAAGWAACVVIPLVLLVGQGVGPRSYSAFSRR